jgi:hypothetical protein
MHGNSLSWGRGDYGNLMANPKDPQRYATGQQRDNILKRDGYRCRYCRTSVTNASANMEHIKPWAHGGKTAFADMVTACWSCNKLKGNRLGVEPLPIEPRTRFKHKRTGCIKPECKMRHYDLHPKSVWMPQPCFKRDYETVPEYQTACKHKRSPDCLRQRCLVERGVPYQTITITKGP